MDSYNLSLLLDWVKEEKERLYRRHNRIETSLRRLDKIEELIISSIEPSAESNQKAKRARAKRD